MTQNMNGLAKIKDNIFEIKPIETIKFDSPNTTSTCFSKLNKFTKSYRTELWKFKSRVNLCQSPEKGGFKAKRMINSQQKLKRRLNKTMESVQFTGLYISNTNNTNNSKIMINDYGAKQEMGNTNPLNTPEAYKHKAKEV
mmetsp:Transcript_34051/g.33589  ORF Transcript_34051/g.33589 Transcript_34051/m.33589 type:complete len:140 (-) Transcript_34051:49-468(-)